MQYCSVPFVPSPNIAVRPLPSFPGRSPGAHPLLERVPPPRPEALRPREDPPAPFGGASDHRRHGSRERHIAGYTGYCTICGKPVRETRKRMYGIRFPRRSTGPSATAHIWTVLERGTSSKQPGLPNSGCLHRDLRRDRNHPQPGAGPDVASRTASMRCRSRSIGRSGRVDPPGPFDISPNPRRSARIRSGDDAPG